MELMLSPHGTSRIYYNPFPAGSAKGREHWLNFLNSATTARYQADCVGQFLAETSHEQVAALERSTERLDSTLHAGFTEVSERQRGMADLQARSNALLDFANRQTTELRSIGHEANRLLNSIDQRLALQIEEQRVTNILQENVAELLRLPDSQRQRQFHIETGLRFYSNAAHDPDLYHDALKELLAAEALMPSDYSVLHQIGIIYLYCRPVVDVPKAAEYLTKAGKYAASESHPDAKRTGNFLAKPVTTRFRGQPDATAQKVTKFASLAYLHAGQAQYSLGNFAEAVKLIDKSCAMDKSSRAAKFFQAKYLAASGKKDRALTALRSLPYDEETMKLVAADFDLARELAAKWLPEVTDYIASAKAEAEAAARAAAEAKATAEARAKAEAQRREDEKKIAGIFAAQRRVELYGPAMRAAGFAEAQINALLVQGGTVVELREEGNGQAVAKKLLWAGGSSKDEKVKVIRGPTGIVAVAPGNRHTVLLKNDGTVQTSLDKDLDTDDPHNVVPVPDGLYGVVAIAAGRRHGVALKYHGKVVAWGRNDCGQCSVPAGLSDVVAVAAYGDHTLVLKEDGTVMAWGVCHNPSSAFARVTLPDGLLGVIAIATAGNMAAALRRDGSVVEWVLSESAQVQAVANLTGAVAISMGEAHASYDRPHGLALKNDGTTVAWGAPYGNKDVPLRERAVAVGANTGACLALLRDGAVVGWYPNWHSHEAFYSFDIQGAVAFASGCSSRMFLTIQPFSHTQGRFVTQEESAAEGQAAIARMLATLKTENEVAQAAWAKELQERIAKCRRLTEEADAAVTSFFFRDLAKAQQLYRQAADLGSGKAKRRLSDLDSYEGCKNIYSIYHRDAGSYLSGQIKDEKRLNMYPDSW